MTPNTIKYRKKYCEILLTNHKKEVIAVSKISKESITLVTKYHWVLFNNGRNKYVMSTKIGNQKQILLHKLLRKTKKYCIDHINNDGLDNRLENLREATRSQNQMNRKLNKNSLTKNKGITFHKKKLKWQARISINNKRLSLGYFKILKKAITARKNAENKYHKQFTPW